MRNKAYRIGLALLLALGIWRQPAGAAIAKAPTLYVLVIGISDYAADDMPDLRGAADAQAMAAVLEASGVGPNIDIKIRVNQQATKAAILQAVNQAGAAVRPPGDILVSGDTFVFYFSGHGLSKEGETWLLPHDAEPRDLGTWIRAAELQAVLDKVQAHHRLLLFDSMYIDIEAGIKGTHVLQATGPGGTAMEGKEHGGHFTAVLLQGLRGWADADQDMQVSAFELAGFVGRQLPISFDHAQFPSIRLYGPDFPLVGKPRGDSPDPPVGLADKLDADLVNLIRAYEAGGIEGAQAYGAEHRIEVQGDQVQVTVTATSEDALGALKGWVAGAGGTVETEFENVLYATLPVGTLERFVMQESVWRVDGPRQAVSIPGATR